MAPSLFVRFFTHLFVERPVRHMPLAELINQLQQSTHEMALRLQTAQNTPENHQKLAHIIAIECWGQTRLRVALGQPFVSEEANRYQPSGDSTWAELIQSFLSVRQETLEIAQAILQADLPDTLKIIHNQFGPLSIKGWLRYLNEHASLEGE